MHCNNSILGKINSYLRALRSMGDIKVLSFHLCVLYDSISTEESLGSIFPISYSRIVFSKMYLCIDSVLALQLCRSFRVVTFLLSPLTTAGA